MDQKKVLKRFIPMSETAYYILITLAEENHGYGIMQEVEKLTEGRLRLGAGTLYGTLGKMENEKIITATSQIDRRKMYKLTDLGKELIRTEINRLEELLKNGKKLRRKSNERNKKNI